MKYFLLSGSLLFCSGLFAQQYNQAPNENDDNNPPPQQMMTNVSINTLSNYGNIAPAMINRSNVVNLVARSNVSRGAYNQHRSGNKALNPVNNSKNNDNNDNNDFELALNNLDVNINPPSINMDNVLDNVEMPQVQAPQLNISLPQAESNVPKVHLDIQQGGGGIGRPQVAVSLPKMHMQFDRKSSGKTTHRKAHHFSFRKSWKNFKHDFRIKYRKMTRKRKAAAYSVAGCCHFF